MDCIKERDSQLKRRITMTNLDGDLLRLISHLEQMDATRRDFNEWWLEDALPHFADCTERELGGVWDLGWKMFTARNPDSV